MFYGRIKIFYKGELKFGLDKSCHDQRGGELEWNWVFCPPKISFSLVSIGLHTKYELPR